MSPEIPLRARHRVFEPQLTGALGWLAAAAIIVLLGPVARVLPPELAALLGGCSVVALTMHVALPRLLPRLYPRLLPDSLRTAIYATALLGFGSTAIAGVVAGLALPRCTDGPLTTTEVVLGGAWIGLVAVQPTLFGRTLALEYLWPSSPHGYETRWVQKLVAPILALVAVLAFHRILEPSVWGTGGRARELLREIAAQPDEAATRRLLRDESQRLSEPDQRRIAESAIEHSRCDDQLLQKLIGVPPTELAAQLDLQRGLRRHAIAARLAEGATK